MNNCPTEYRKSHMNCTNNPQVAHIAQQITENGGYKVVLPEMLHSSNELIHQESVRLARQMIDNYTKWVTDTLPNEITAGEILKMPVSQMLETAKSTEFMDESEKKSLGVGILIAKRIFKDMREQAIEAQLVSLRGEVPSKKSNFLPSFMANTVAGEHIEDMILGKIVNMTPLERSQICRSFEKYLKADELFFNTKYEKMSGIRGDTEITLNRALDVLKNGDEDGAWEIAKKDTGLNDGVTKAEWLDFARKAIERRKQEEDLNA